MLLKFKIDLILSDGAGKRAKILKYNSDLEGH